MVSTETTESLLAQHPNWVYDRIDFNGNRYFSDFTCDRCGGHGYYAMGVCNGQPILSPYDGGVCYKCGGSGKMDKPNIVEVYTPEYWEQFERVCEIRRREREQKFLDELNVRLTKLGFGVIKGEDAALYRVVGDTFPIKDELKARGCRFNPCVGWYAPAPIEGYEMQKMESASVLNINAEARSIEWKDPKDVRPLWTESTRAPSKPISEWQGEIGAKLVVKVHIDHKFESHYERNPGWYGTSVSYMYLMSDANGNQYKWSTQKGEYPEGADVTIMGTVKAHDEYVTKMGQKIKQTVLTRCKMD